MLLKNIFFMALTTGAKMLSGIVVFVIMAKVMGPTDFGHIAYAFTLATLYVLIVDYGFTQQLLREVGVKPDAINQLVGNIVVIKIILTFVTVLICLVSFYIFPKEKVTEQIFWIFLISLMLGSFSEFLNSAFRAVGKYKEETNIATVGSVIHFSCLLLILLINPTLESVSIGFLVSKLIFLVISWYSYKAYVGRIDFKLNIKNLLSGVKRGFPYAADCGLTNLIQQIDTLLVNHYLGFASVGLYQAATKWLQGAMQFAPVLSNVYLPTLASNTNSDVINRKHTSFLTLKMIILGSISWVCFSFLGPFIFNYIYGSEFEDLVPLWPYIGSLIWIRYLVASQGVIMTAYGKQSIRVLTQITSISLFVVLSVWILPILGLKGVLIALNITFMVIFIIYNLNLIRSHIPTGFNSTNILISLSVTLIAFANLYPLF